MQGYVILIIILIIVMFVVGVIMSWIAGVANYKSVYGWDYRIMHSGQSENQNSFHRDEISGNWQCRYCFL